MSRFFIALTVLFTISTPGFAQDETEGRAVKYKSRTEIDFEGVDVSGELVKPQGQLLLDRKRANFNPLIRLRDNFDDEMRQSIDDVK